MSAARRRPLLEVAVDRRAAIIQDDFGVVDTRINQLHAADSSSHRTGRAPDCTA
jgi:hypothetical protein